MIDLEELEGTSINDSFVLDRPIGRGASGIVYRAKTLDNDWIALKLIAPSLGLENSSARYLRGTRLASQLRHSHIVRVLDSGRWGPKRRYYYLAMELVEGTSLGFIPKLGLSAQQSTSLICQILEAAVYVHARGTLHRDLKPDNVMVSRLSNGRLRCQVTDFGIASNRLQDATLTHHGSIVGTPAYMAPEQAQGLPSIGPAADIYAIGLMLYELLCGRLPFSGNIQKLLFDKVHQDPPPIPGSNAIPPELAEVVMNMVARRPEDRIAHAGDAIDALRTHTQPPIVDATQWTEIRALTGGPLASVTETTAMTERSDATFSIDTKPRSGSDTWSPTEPKSSLWGRHAIRNQLEMYASLAESGSAKVCLLSGNLGMGKSALVDELAIRVREEGRFQVLSTSYSSASALDGGLRSAIEVNLGVRGRSRETVRQAVNEHMRQAREHDPEEAAALVEWLRPEMDTTLSMETPKSADFSPGLRFVRRLARSRPVLLSIDDLHRGGGRAAALIEFILFEIRFEPCDLFVVGTMVPGDLQPEFRDGLERTNHTEGHSRHMIDVGPLSDSELAHGLRSDLGLSSAQSEQIAERAGGNPMIARGLARASSSGSLDPTLGTVQGDRTHSFDGALQTMLERLLQRALERVKPVETAKKILRAIAMLGPWVEVQLLADYLETSIDDMEFESVLDELIELDIVEEHHLHIEDRIGLRPRILSEILLEGMGRRQRRRMHQRAIDILSERDDVDGSVLGEHYLAIGDRAKAIDCWKDAERQALLAGSPFAAVEIGRKLLPLLDEPERSSRAIHLGRVLLDAGDPRQAEILLEPVTRSMDTDLALIASDVLCDVYENLGRGAEWSALVERIRGRLPEAGTNGQQAAHCALAMWSTSHGDDSTGLMAAEKALKLARTPAESRRAAQRVAFSCLPSGALERAAEAARQALDASGGHPRMRARSLRTLGVVRMWQGLTEEAISHHEQVLALARWKGLSSRAALALQDLGDSLRTSRRYAAATERYAASIRAAEALDLGSTVYLVRFKLLLCEISVDPATDIHERIWALATPAVRAGLGLATPFAHLLSSWAASKQGEPERAREELEKARVLEQFTVDPQVPEIFRQIRESLDTELG